MLTESQRESGRCRDAEEVVGRDFEAELKDTISKREGLVALQHP